MGVLHSEPHAGFTQLVGLKGQESPPAVGIAYGDRDQGAGHRELCRMSGACVPSRQILVDQYMWEQLTLEAELRF